MFAPRNGGWYCTPASVPSAQNDGGHTPHRPHVHAAHARSEHSSFSGCSVGCYWVVSYHTYTRAPRRQEADLWSLVQLRTGPTTDMHSQVGCTLCLDIFYCLYVAIYITPGPRTAHCHRTNDNTAICIQASQPPASSHSYSRLRPIDHQKRSRSASSEQTRGSSGLRGAAAQRAAWCCHHQLPDTTCLRCVLLVLLLT